MIISPIGALHRSGPDSLIFIVTAVLVACLGAPEPLLPVGHLILEVMDFVER